MNLKEKIINEMTIDYNSNLEKCFELVKKLIKITKLGQIVVLFRDKLSIKSTILLYLIGILYAKKAEFVKDNYVSAKELLDQLGISEGTFYARIKELRDNKLIKKINKGKNAFYTISNNFVERILKEITNKLNI